MFRFHPFAFVVSLVAISSVFEAHALCSLQKCTSLFGQSDNVLDAGNGKCAVCNADGISKGCAVGDVLTFVNSYGFVTKQMKCSKSGWEQVKEKIEICSYSPLKDESLLDIAALCRKDGVGRDGIGSVIKCLRNKEVFSDVIKSRDEKYDKVVSHHEVCWYLDCPAGTAFFDGVQDINYRCFDKMWQGCFKLLPEQQGKSNIVRGRLGYYVPHWKCDCPDGSAKNYKTGGCHTDDEKVKKCADAGGVFKTDSRGNGRCVCKKPDYVYFDERAKCIPKSEYNEIMRQNRDAAKQSCEDSGGVWEGQCLCDLKEGLIGDKNIDNKCICLPGFARVEKGGRCRVKTSTIQKCINSGGQWPDGGYVCECPSEKGLYSDPAAEDLYCKCYGDKRYDAKSGRCIESATGENSNVGVVQHNSDDEDNVVVDGDVGASGDGVINGNDDTEVRECSEKELRGANARSAKRNKHGTCVAIECLDGFYQYYVNGNYMGFCAAHTACNRFPGMVAEIMDGKISCQPKLEEDGEISEVSDSVIGGMFD